MGKKKVKAVARALRSVNQTPKIPGRQKPADLFSTTPPQSSTHNIRPSEDSSSFHRDHSPEPVFPTEPLDFIHEEITPSKLSQPKTSLAKGDENRKLPNESSPLTIQARTSQSVDESYSPWDSGAVTNYGSINPSPPSDPALLHPSSLELPDPALSPSEESFARHNRAWRPSRMNSNIDFISSKGRGYAAGPYKIDATNDPSKTDASLSSAHRNIFKNRRAFSTPSGPKASTTPVRPPLFQRIFSNAGLESPRSGDIPLEVYKEFDLRQADFLKFLDKELEKIETFYREKETEARDRLRVLRLQLHEMRDRRIEEVLEAQRSKERAKREHQRIHTDNGEGPSSEIPSGLERSVSSLKWIHPIESAIRVGAPRFGKNTEALPRMSSPPELNIHGEGDKTRIDSWKDFTRRPAYHDHVPYRTAKRKLRLALQEFYRGLELLKSYALLNRTAFRKINKKYDKAVKARPTGRYMTEKVNKAWFVQSEVLEEQIVAVEDLYARYFERGHHKVAVGKLRSKTMRAGEYSASIFRNGLLIAAGVVFGAQGVINGAERLRSRNETMALNTSYLLQVRFLLSLAKTVGILTLIDLWWILFGTTPFSSLLPGL